MKRVAVFLDEPYEAQSGWDFVVGAPLLQMVCENVNLSSATASKTDPEIDELGDADSPEMIELTALTKPGPFGKRTHELGNYLGMRRERQTRRHVRRANENSGIH